MKELRIQPAAVEDAETAAQWYEAQRPELGITSIAIRPHGSQERNSEHRWPSGAAVLPERLGIRKCPGKLIMTTTSIIVEIDSELAEAVKELAARRRTSVSRLVSERLEALVQRDRAYEAVKRRALDRLSRPVELKWSKPRSRDKVHERD